MGQHLVRVRRPLCPQIGLALSLASTMASALIAWSTHAPQPSTTLALLLLAASCIVVGTQQSTSLLRVHTVAGGVDVGRNLVRPNVIRAAWMEEELVDGQACARISLVRDGWYLASAGAIWTLSGVPLESGAQILERLGQGADSSKKVRLMPARGIAFGAALLTWLMLATVVRIPAILPSVCILVGMAILMVPRDILLSSGGISVKYCGLTRWAVRWADVSEVRRLGSVAIELVAADGTSFRVGPSECPPTQLMELIRQYWPGSLPPYRIAGAAARERGLNENEIVVDGPKSKNVRAGEP